MQNESQIEMLKKLVQVDIDTVHSYDRALEQIPDKILRSRLQAFRDNHRKHIAELSSQILTLGGRPPEPTSDLKGFIIQTVTALRTATGMKGALKALKTTEEVSNSYYEKTIPEEISPDLKEILRRFFSEEKNHLRYIKDNLQVL